MLQKTVVLTALVASMYAVTVSASGTHEQGHESGTPGHHDESAKHGDHEHEGSPVGQPAPASQATKVIEVTTLDTMRYEFSTQPQLEGGDIVRFVVTNKGQIPHEFSIGDAQEQKAHQAMMREMPNMVHEDGNTITINPGETKELTWQFAADNEVVFACNIPGHFEAGMFKKAEVGSGHAAHDH